MQEKPFDEDGAPGVLRQEAFYEVDHRSVLREQVLRERQLTGLVRSDVPGLGSESGEGDHGGVEWQLRDHRPEFE